MTPLDYVERRFPSVRATVHLVREGRDPTPEVELSSRISELCRINEWSTFDGQSPGQAVALKLAGATTLSDRTFLLVEVNRTTGKTTIFPLPEDGIE